MILLKTKIPLIALLAFCTLLVPITSNAQELNKVVETDANGIQSTDASELNSSEAHEDSGYFYKFNITALIILVGLTIAGCAMRYAYLRDATTTYPFTQLDQVERFSPTPSPSSQRIANFQSHGEIARSACNKTALIGTDAVMISNLGGYSQRMDQRTSTDTQTYPYTRICATVTRCI